MSVWEKIATFILILALSAPAASATAAATYPWIASMQGLAYALGWAMMVILGIKWVTSDSANDRQDAKKGMMYIVIGLLVAASMCGLMCIYCNAATNSMNLGGNPLIGGAPSFNCDMASIGCPNC